jgi:probable F420-dependent oxidoreductase
VKLGILPPYHGSAVGDPAFVRSFCAAVEAEGLESIWTVEHVVVPADYSSRYPYAETGRMPLDGNDPIPDPLEWLAFAAGLTTSVKLGTAILILPEHNPVHLAKRLATIDALSGGRMILGIGVGWMKEESEAVGVPFAERGARTDEYVAALRTLWRDDVATFEGRWVQFTGVRSRPQPVQAHGVPIMVGGHSPASARRAGALGDGFYPLGVDAAELERLLGIMTDAAQAAGRDPSLIEITTGAPSDQETAERFASLGVARFILSARDTADGVERAVGRFREKVKL